MNKSNRFLMDVKQEEIVALEAMTQRWNELDTSDYKQKKKAAQSY